ncbi:DUF2802 domain-containing protein [Alphaproteobacteria bacterium]|jgi:hypothetical protein|nr:DUF2802 domain-containing protein [Alphaproteobacteria bacterium]
MIEIPSPIGIVTFICLVTLALAVLILVVKRSSHRILAKRLGDVQRQLAALESQNESQIAAATKAAETMEKLRIGAEETIRTIEAMRIDMTHLDDEVRGEIGTSRAIEMARAGASKEDIAEKTGLSLERADAIVTFHGVRK